MRRYLPAAFGLVELAFAAALAALGYHLPSPDDARRGFEGAGRATAAAGGQVRALRGEVAGLRAARVGDTADRLGSAARALAATLEAGRVDFEAVRAVRDGLDRAAGGLAGLGRAVEPEALAAMAAGLGEAAEFLEVGVIPAASAAARELEASSGRLADGARTLARVADRLAPDLGPVEQARDGLARFDEGLAALDDRLDPARLAPLRAATGGAGGVVAEAARLAERAAGFTYPAVEMDGVRPRVRQRPFWPGAKEVGADLRKVSAGVAALDRELRALADDLPGLRAAVADSRKALAASRAALDSALEGREEVERLIAEIPEQAGRLAEGLPGLTGELARALRSADRLAGAARALRRAGETLDAAGARWPEVREGLAGSAALLAAARDRMDGVLRDRESFEAAADEARRLARGLADAVPALADRVEDRLGAEDRTLAELALGIEQVDALIPAYAHAADRTLRLGRLVAWLVAALAALHGVWLCASAASGRPTG